MLGSPPGGLQSPQEEREWAYGFVVGLEAQGTEGEEAAGGAGGGGRPRGGPTAV